MSDTENNQTASTTLDVINENKQLANQTEVESEAVSATDPGITPDEGELKEALPETASEQDDAKEPDVEKDVSDTASEMTNPTSSSEKPEKPKTRKRKRKSASKSSLSSTMRKHEKMTRENSKKLKKLQKVDKIEKALKKLTRKVHKLEKRMPVCLKR